MKIISCHPNFEIKNLVLSLIDLFDYSNNIEYDKIKLETLTLCLQQLNRHKSDIFY